MVLLVGNHLLSENTTIVRWHMNVELILATASVMVVHQLRRLYAKYFEPLLRIKSGPPELKQVVEFLRLILFTLQYDVHTGTLLVVE